MSTVNEYSVNGTQVFSRSEIVEPSDPFLQNPPKVRLFKTKIDQLGYKLSQSDVVGETSETWENTRTTVERTRSVKAINGTVNPEILAVQKAILVVNDATTPTASIGIEADITGDAGTYFGMNLFNDTDTDFTVTSTMPYQGSVVFRQEGVGADTTTTAIKQGTITMSDADIPATTIIDPSLLSFSDGVDTTSFNQAGVTTTADLTLDVGADLLLNGTITETTAGGFTGQYLKITINGTAYKLQLLAD